MQKTKGFIAAVGFILTMLAVCAACALTFTVGRFLSGDTAASVAASTAQLPVIVIDAGHGGMDGGAVGADGSLEKEINMAVAERLEALCRWAGLDCVMTRTEDRMLVDESIKSHRKMHDLKNRLAVAGEITESGREAVLVSIHMNNFSSAKYSGLQVWYSPADPRSAGLAATVQGYARTFLDPDNDRETKRATSAIYLLDRATMPAILIECGFLSNPAECERLGTEAYQTELAATIFAALTKYLSDLT